MKKGIVIGALSAFVLLLVAVACGPTNQATQTLANDTSLMGRQLAQYRLAQPIHFYTYSQDLATMNAIMDARTAGKTTWSAEFLQNVPDPIFTCNSRGYPIPGDSELTNPDQANYVGNYNYYVVPQIDPNGLYSSHATSSTYIVCVDDDGSAYVHYSEPMISVWPFAMTWDYTQHRAVKADPKQPASYTVTLNNNVPAPVNVDTTVPNATPTAVRR